MKKKIFFYITIIMHVIFFLSLFYMFPLEQFYLSTQFSIILFNIFNIKIYISLLFILLLILLLFYVIRKNKIIINKQKELIEKEKKYANDLKYKIEELEEKLSNIKEQHAEETEKEKQLRYYADGMTIFSEIISKSKSNLNVLGQKLISNIVEYIEANSGAIYVYNDETNELEFLSGFAPDISQITKTFKPGEGYIGTCFNEASIIEIENVTEEYFKIYSGLGEEKPRHIIFIPLKQDEEKMGVLEVASFNKLEQYKIEFLQKLAENIASRLAISRANEKMQKMIDQMKIQARELQEREEELRQNLEEMQATQEELQKQRTELAREKALMDALLANSAENIYFKDLESRFLKVSHNMTKLFNVKSVDEIIGKSDFDFFTEEHARPAYEDEQNIIKTGVPIINKIEKETHPDGRVTWAVTSKFPLRDANGNIIGTFGVSKDITEIKEMEFELKAKTEALMAQEEELRQNLEEMQATQEELQRQLDENRRIQEELAREKALMDALLANSAENIYFKDLESRFLKVSHNMTKLFNVKSVDEIIGKSDFDFFTEEHARPAYEDEQNIIKTGVPIINKIEKETHPDGRVTWAVTSKFPLRDANGNIIGTFGVSKDITEIKEMEFELKAKTEALMAQEEELRQNLEEMQVIQENYENKLKEIEKEKQKLLENENKLKEKITKIEKDLYDCLKKNKN